MLFASNSRIIETDKKESYLRVEVSCDLSVNRENNRFCINMVAVSNDVTLFHFSSRAGSFAPLLMRCSETLNSQIYAEIYDILFNDKPEQKS